MTKQVIFLENSSHSKSREKQPFQYWDSPENQRNFLLKFAEQNNIHNPKDWNTVTAFQVSNFLYHLFIDLDHRSGRGNLAT